MYNTLNKNIIRKNKTKKRIENIHRRKSMTMLFYYYIYECQL